MKILPGVLFALAVLALSGPAVADHDPGCRSRWDKSSAAKTCITLEFIVKTGDSCRIYARCVRPAYDIGAGVMSTQASPLRANWYLSDIEKLVNCDGRLKVGTCDRPDSGSAPYVPRPPE